jgi:3-isopropylmalate dehydrogenase
MVTKQGIIHESKITLLPGDGIGPEVVGEAVRVLDVIASKYNHTFEYKERLMGGCSIDKYGSSLTDETLADCQSADAVLLGAVGGPKWDDPAAKDRPERGCSRFAKVSACLPICALSKSTRR